MDKILKENIEKARLLKLQHESLLKQCHEVEANLKAFTSSEHLRERIDYFNNKTLMIKRGQSVEIMKFTRNEDLYLTSDKKSVEVEISKIYVSDNARKAHYGSPLEIDRREFPARITYSEAVLNIDDHSHYSIRHFHEDLLNCTVITVPFEVFKEKFFNIFNIDSIINS